MKLKDFDFRLWHKPSKSFVEIRGGFLTANAKDEIVFEKSLIVPIDDENVEIELWSGFYDSKGTKIYEGDIVICNTLKFVVEYKHGKFILRQIAENGFSVSLHYSETLEVLGNIHENADLLGKERGLIMRIECKYEDIYDSKGFPKY